MRGTTSLIRIGLADLDQALRYDATPAIPARFASTILANSANSNARLEADHPIVKVAFWSQAMNPVTQGLPVQVADPGSIGPTDAALIDVLRGPGQA